MEHLFMQIFARKAWIEGQLKHQIQSYGESMAYNLLAEGNRPPPWLWREGLGNFDFPDPKAPDGELLASGILNPVPWATTPSANNAPLNLPTLKADKVTLFNKFTDTCATNKYTCVENSGKAVPHASELCSDRKAEPKIVEVCSEFDSLARIQNLECRHRDMENHFYGKEKTTSHLGPNRSMDEHMGQLTQSRLSPVDADTVKELSAMSDSLHDVVHSAKGVLPCGDLEKLNGSENGISQYRKPDRDKVFNGVVEYEQEYVELDDSGHHSHLLSGQQSVHLDVCSRSSPDYLVNQAVEDQCSIQLEEVLKCGVACKPFVANTLIEPKYFEIHNSRECGLNIGSADALESETKASYSANAFTEMEVWQSYRVSSGSDSNQAQAPLVDRQFHKYDGLPTVMTYMEKANKVSCQALETGKLSEVLESESVSHHMSKLLHGPAKASSRILCGSSKCAPSCSSSVTDLMLNSDVDFFSHRSAGLDGSKRQSFRDSFKHKIEVQQTEQLTKETDSDHLQLMKLTHNDIFSEAGETEASVVEAVKRSALKSIRTTTPMDAGSGFKMLVGKDSSTNSVVNSEISGSCKLVGPVVPSNEAANCLLAQGNVANGSIINAELATTGKRSYTSATHSAQPTTCHFLRSSTSHEKSPRSLQGNSSVCYFQKNSKNLETKGNETCSDPEDVTEKSVNYHKITPDITKTHNELPKARYLLRNLDSHDNASSRGTQSMKTIDDTCEATWPKRRKTDNPSSNVHGTSPRVRIKHFLHNQEGSTSKCNIKGTTDMGSKLIPSSMETDIGICDTALANSLELLHQNKNCCTIEGCTCIGEDDQALVAPLPLERAQEETFSDLGRGILLKDGAKASELINCELQKLYTSDDGHDSMLAQNTQGHEIQRSPSNSERFFKDKENSDVDLCLHMHDTTQFADCDDDSVGFDETMPEHEDFTIGIINAGLDDSVGSGSCKLVGPVVPSNEAANCLLAQGNVANGCIINAELATTGKRSYTSATHSAQPTTCYFLRSFTSHEKSPRSLQGNSSVCYFQKNSKNLETKGNETCSDPEDVTEKSVNYHKITPDITKTHNELLKARYLLRSLDSHDNASSRGTQSMKTIDDTCEATWPKRRKTDNPSSNVHGTSPRVRIKHFLHNQEGSTSKCNIKGTTYMGSKLIPSSMETGIGICDTALANSLELLHQNKNCCTMEGCTCIGEDDQALVAPLPLERAQEETFSDLGHGILLKDGAKASELINCELQKLYTSDDGHDSMLAQNTQRHEIQRSPSNSERFFKDKENSDVDLCLHMHDTTQFADCADDSVGFDENRPELEGFTIGIPSITENRCSDFQSLQKERNFVLEQLCKTRNIPTPVSNLSSKYRINEIPDVGQSLPSGILERMDLSCALQFSDADMEHFRGSNDGDLAGFYSNLGTDINGNFAERLYSRSLPSLTTRNYYEGGKLPLSPRVMKFSQKVVPGTTGATSEKVGSNPELICFRIDENSTIANENEHIDRLEASEEDLVLKGIQNSDNRKALVDVTQKYQNAPTTVSDSKKFQDRGSLESVNSESYFGTQVSSHLSLGNAHASNTKFKIKDKGNGHHSVNNNRLRKAALSLLNRSSKPRVSEKTNKRVRSQSNSGKECKRDNIISSISSFIPFVRPKQQAAAPLKGKREIKVKALETAEAAKRLEEQKHNEREMRKVAAKLEKERLERENIRLLEVKQKQKEEEKMKKEADIAARKRQREEDGKKEKERKRRCVEETRRQHKEQEERSCAIKAEKDIRQKASDYKERMQKGMDLEAKRQLKTKKIGVDGCQEGTDMQSKAMKLLVVATSSGSNTLEAVDDPNKPNDIVKVASNSDDLQGARKEKIYISEINQDLQSYGISPYIDSADEDDEAGIRRKRKHVPLWARRECLEQIIFSQQFLDPTKIFCRKLSFHLTEVLSTRTTRRPF